MQRPDLAILGFMIAAAIAISYFIFCYFANKNSEKLGKADYNDGKVDVMFSKK